MHHPRYDIDHWRKLYPRSFPAGERSREADAEFVFSPPSIAINEQIRECLWPDIDRYQHVPCDLFTWAWGPSPALGLTQIGGTPFMDASSDWPLDPNGKPMGFVCQINFQDSLDLFPNVELPGDLLLFFCKIGTGCKERVYLDYDEDPATSCFRWIRRGDVKRPFNKPVESGLKLWPLHGIVRRSFDMPELYGMHWEIQPPYPTWVDPPAVWHSTKIGGVPNWEQGQDLSMTPERGTFLCQIMSDRADGRSPLSYHGHPDPLPDDLMSVQSNRLCFGDLGSAYLFLVDGQIYFCSQA